VIAVQDPSRVLCEFDFKTVPKLDVLGDLEMAGAAPGG